MEHEPVNLSLDERERFGFYLSFTGRPSRSSHRQIFLDHLIAGYLGPWIILDFDSADRILGIEILGDDDDQVEDDEIESPRLQYPLDERERFDFYLTFTGHRTADPLVHRSSALHEIVPGSAGPPVSFDFDATGRIMGIRIQGEG